MAYLSTGDKYSHLKQLISLAKADQEFSVAELSFIVWTAKKLDISDKELNRIASEEVRHSAPLTELDKLTLFHDCLKLIYVDGLVHSEEIKHCLEIGKGIGLNEDKLLKVMMRAEQVPPKMISLEEFKTLYYEV